MDDERVAALHDGRLGVRERDELLSGVLADDEEYALFAETAAVLRELEEAHASTPSSSAAGGGDDAAASGEHGSGGVIPLATRRPPVPPITAAGADAPVDSRDSAQSGDSRVGVISLDSRRRSQARPWRVYGAIAAGLVGIGLAATLLTRSRDTRLDDPTRAVAMLEGGAARGPAAGWGEAFQGRKRGGTQQFRIAVIAVRLGAYLVDLELAAASRDTALSGLSGDVVALLEQDSAFGGGQAASVYREVERAAAANPRADVRPLLARGRKAMRFVAIPPEWLELGVWGEAARTAAARHDAGFFRSGRTGAVLERATTLPELDKSTGAALRAVRAAIPADGHTLTAEEWSTLQAQITKLLRLAGRS
jgi:hypothetical protein